MMKTQTHPYKKSSCTVVILIRMMTILWCTSTTTVSAAVDLSATTITPPIYGVDVSFPMTHFSVTTNYPWLPHNNNSHQSISFNTTTSNSNNNTSSLPSSSHDTTTTITTTTKNYNYDINYYKDMPIQPLGNRQQFYKDYIQGCSDYYDTLMSNTITANTEDGDETIDNNDRDYAYNIKYHMDTNGKTLCYEAEEHRIQRTLRQPMGVYNYTKLGYKKMKTPKHIFDIIQNFWKSNRDKASKEQWTIGNTCVNYWSSPTYMMSVANYSLLNGGNQIQYKLYNAIQPIIQEWIHQYVVPSSLYGIRIYTNNSILAPHVDTLPRVASAIINVDQDVDEPWPLEVIGHDGIAVNITMEPGDLVLYESHSILHGRPFPLNGKFYANIFIHFEPIGPISHRIGDDDNDEEDKKYNIPNNNFIPSDLPKYVVRGSQLEEEWYNENPNGYIIKKQKDVTPGSTEIHYVAAHKKPQQIKTILNSYDISVDIRDINGWTALHEAARAGRADSIQILLDYGADMNALTKQTIENDDNKEEDNNKGVTALWLALYFHYEDHDAVRLLHSYGAKIIGPGNASSSTSSTSCSSSSGGGGNRHCELQDNDKEL